MLYKPYVSTILYFIFLFQNKRLSRPPDIILVHLFFLIIISSTLLLFEIRWFWWLVVFLQIITVKSLTTMWSISLVRRVETF